MLRRRLTLGGFLIGAVLGGCLFNAPPDHQGLLAQLAEYSALPLLILLSPILFLLSAAGLYSGPIVGQAVSAVLTWTLLGFISGLVADRRPAPALRRQSRAG